MQFKLHDFQQRASDLTVEHFNQADRDERMIVASPTGTGKSVIAIDVQRRVPRTWIITPRFEIVMGLMEKIGFDISKAGKAKIESAALARNICTPVKFRNLLMKGVDLKVRRIIWDEGHHHNAETYSEIDTLCRVPAICLTASPYRGTPKQTVEFRRLWGVPNWAITYPDAYRDGYINVPECTTVPLVDDDIIEITNGEFVLSRVTSEYTSKLEHVISLAKLDKSTMLSFPGQDIVRLAKAYCDRIGLPANVVITSTTPAERRKAFRECIERKALLLQINVVSEGVDLPIRRLIDCSPTLSPVKWIQQIGRIMRPSSEVAEYICTNRNLQRHCYLLEGCLPISVISQSQQVFPITSRAGVRVFGLESVGRFEPVVMPLASGCTGHIYCVSAPDGPASVIHYAAIVHPGMAEPIWAQRQTIKKEYDSEQQRWNMEYGSWERCYAPDDLKGFKSIPVSKVTPKMADWWKSSAKTFGLDPAIDVNKKNFQALPILKDLRLRLT